MAEKYPSPSEKVDELSGESPNKDVCTSVRPGSRGHGLCSVWIQRYLSCFLIMCTTRVLRLVVYWSINRGCTYC